MLYIISNVIWVFVIGVLGYLHFWYLYVVLFFLCPVFFIVLSRFITARLFFQFLLISFSIGFILFSGTYFESYLLDEKIKTFDVDKDTIFAPYEQTLEQQEYFNRMVNDTNELFRYVIAFPYALSISFIYISFYKFIKIFTKKRTQMTNRQKTLKKAKTAKTL